MDNQILEISSGVLAAIHRHGEAAYPEEGAGFMIGEIVEGKKRVTVILPVNNSREDSARHNRYLLTPQDYARAEDEAAKLSLDVLGIFHSHPDHPNWPSEFDREWAMPWFAYLITSVMDGKAIESRSWQLNEDRSQFVEETIVQLVEQSNTLTQEE